MATCGSSLRVNNVTSLKNMKSVQNRKTLSFLPRGGVCPWGRGCLPGECLPRGVCLGGVCLGGVCPNACWDAHIPLCTESQTSVKHYLAPNFVYRR